MASNLYNSNLPFTKGVSCRFYLCVSNCYRRLYQRLAGFEHSILIALYIVRYLPYPLGHTTSELLVLLEREAGKQLDYDDGNIFDVFG